MVPTPTLIDRLQGHLKQGDHICVVCSTPAERFEAAVQYIVDGLRRNECVIYAADADSVVPLREMLEKRGVDVAAEIARGALAFPTAAEAYLRNGGFDPDLIYAEFDQAITNALAAGYSGCRFAGEPVWAIDRAELRPGLIEFERKLNDLFRHRKATGLCVYERDAWPAEVVRDVLRTHPVAVVDELVCAQNPYYESSEIASREVGAGAQVDWMIRQLRQVRLQESRLHIALEAGQLGSWDLDLKADTSVRTVRHDSIFGYDHLLPSWGYRDFIQHVVEEDRQRVDEALIEAVRTGTIWRFQCRIRRRNDGAIRWIEAHGRPEPDGASGDDIESILGIVADITERKEMEEALREADRRKDEFLATLAHELRNPLAPILNVLHLMEHKAAKDPELAELHGVMDRQTRHLARLVDDLLDVSRITTGRIALDRETLDLRDVLKGAVEASEPFMKAANHSLTLNLPDKPVPVRGDAVRLSQVFLNILNNSAKYTAPGGQVDISAEHNERRARIIIRDNGMGIEPELLPTIFKMFVQGRQAGEQTQTGLGVGLPLARQLVELHGGTVTARSAGCGRGSEFVVSLPLVTVRNIGDSGSRASTASNGRKQRILVVDDNVDAADSLGLSLGLHGHEVQCCYEGARALALVKEFDPEVVVLDIGLPDLDGYEVARRARQIKSDLLLIALTGWGQEEDRTRALKAGFDLHRTKPASPQTLLADIGDLCGDNSPNPAAGATG